MQFTEKQVAVNGVSIHVRTQSDSPDAIVLHGGPGAHHDYLLPQFDDLAGPTSLLYYDQRGGGRSPVDRDTTVGYKELIEDLGVIVDQFCNGNATLIGYSFGGLLAMLYAVEHRDTVSRMALVSPAPGTAEGRLEFEKRFAERSMSEEIQKARAELQGSNLKDSDPDEYRRRAFQLSVAGYFYDIENVRELTPFRVTGRVQKSVWESLGDYDIRESLARLDVPSIVLHGSHDPIPIETARDSAERLGAQFVEMEKSGHCPHVEQREEFARVVRDFLEQSA